jgi:hypothetical protein
METGEDTKIKFIMDTDWLIQEPIDFEHKKYVLLGYFKKIDQLLEENKIYPTFIELSLHLASLQTIVKENAILYTNKEFKSCDDEVLMKDLLVKQVPVFSPEEVTEIDSIINYSSSKFFDYFGIVKSYWSIIYDTISVSVKRNKKNMKNGVGYMTYHDRKTNIINVWEYTLSKIVPELNEYNNDLTLIYSGNKKEHTFNEIIEGYSSLSDKEKKYSPVFEMKSSEDYPMDETLIPLFKRKLMSYILQTVRLEHIKKYEG